MEAAIVVVAAMAGAVDAQAAIVTGAVAMTGADVPGKLAIIKKRVDNGPPAF